MTHFFKIFIAFYSKNKTTTLLSITGLSMGLLGILILTAKLVNENSFNKDIKNGKYIYRIISDNEGFKHPLVPFQLGGVLKREIPEIHKYGRYAKLDGLIGFIYGIKNNEKIVEPNFYAADNNFLEILNIKNINGNELHKIEIGNIALSEKTSVKYFGDKNAIGQELSILFKNKTYRFIVVDIFKDIPWNNTFRPEIICNLNFYLDILTNVFGINNHKLTKTLKDDNLETLIVRNINISEKEFGGKFGEVTKVLYKNSHRDTRPYLQNILDVYLNSSDIKNDFIIKGSKENLFYYRLSILLILFITSFNYIILQTSISSQRNLEAGVRKVFGASKKDLSIQYFGEAFLITLLSIPVIFIFYLFYSEFIDKFMFSEVKFHTDRLLVYIVYLLVIVFAIASISSLYIGLYISSLNPVNAIYGSNINKKSKNINLLILLGFQVFISLILVTFSMTLYLQINYALNKSIGIEKDKLILIDFESNISRKDYKILKTEILNLSSVSNVTGGVLLPPTNAAAYKTYLADNKALTSITCESYVVNSDFFKTFNISITNGRSFDFTSQSDLENCIIINQTAVDKYRFSYPLFEKIEGKKIIGITNDFNFHSLHKKIEPSIFFPNNRATRHLAILYHNNINSDNIIEIRNIIIKILKDRMFNVTTFKHKLRELYVKDIGLRNFITFYSIIVTLITLIGVIGITLYISKNERLNISIRKVYGASKIDIIGYFSGKLTISCVIASILSIPLTVIMSNLLLKNYMYTFHINWLLYFAVILIFTFLVILIGIAVVYKTIIDSPTKYLK